MDKQARGRHEQPESWEGGGWAEEQEAGDWLDTGCRVPILRTGHRWHHNNALRQRDPERKLEDMIMTDWLNTCTMKVYYWYSKAELWKEAFGSFSEYTKWSNNSIFQWKLIIYSSRNQLYTTSLHYSLCLLGHPKSMFNGYCLYR